ncbi:cell division protein FtsL [Myxococcota bacterium]|nr:cell division protein FtsL [Myxococcota bacterium]
MRRTSLAHASNAIASTAQRAWQAVTPALPRPVPARLAGLDASHQGHVEIDRLGSYLAIFALVGACLLISAWSRIDLRRTSVELHRAAAAYESAQAENARLQLELATMRDPSRLQQAALPLGLVPNVPVVDLSTR